MKKRTYLVLGKADESGIRQVKWNYIPLVTEVNE
jgi:hypothetical protein